MFNILDLDVYGQRWLNLINVLELVHLQYVMWCLAYMLQILQGCLYFASATFMDVQ